MRKLHIDIETWSEQNLKTGGLYKYAASTELLWLTVQYGDYGKTVLYDCTKENLPDQLITDLQDPDILKIAHNAAFERTCLSSILGIDLPPEQWFCSMALCATAGLPLSLDQASAALGLEIRKDKTGSALIKYFCVPCKPSKVNGMRTRNLPEHAPEKWKAFGEYNRQDVRTEVAICEALRFIKITASEKRVWDLDQRINERGVKVNLTLIRNAIKMDADYRRVLIAEALKITKLQNPNSIAQVKRWLEEETETYIPTLRKTDIPKLIEKFDSEIVKRVLTIREELSKTSVKKYSAMLSAIGPDRRIRGLLQYYGANRTGRWAGRLVQIQNLVKGRYHGQVLNLARDLVIDNEPEILETIYGAIPDTLSQLIRTAFIASAGNILRISDYSAIEARVIAWLAGEAWRLEVFATHGKIYEASAAHMFKIPIESVTKSSDYRAKAKIAELALGYQGGVNALLKMGALEMGLAESELEGLVRAWRTANPKINQFWYDVDRAAKRAIDKGEVITIQQNIQFAYRNKYLMITLPSGRILYYANATLVPGDYGVVILYWGLDQTTKKWTRIKTYGGKLVENIVQATARDILANGLINLDAAGYNVVMHVHDECVCECPVDFGTIEEVNELMCKKSPWMRGLPLDAEGFNSDYYKKD